MKGNPSLLRLAVFLTLVVLALLVPRGVRAQWFGNPVVNTPICSAVEGQSNSVAVSDGAGGAIIAWQDGRPPASAPNIYAQRVNAAGVVQWALNGVVICDEAGPQENPSITSDGAGGAIITWQDDRGDPSGIDIYAQHITAAGVVTWPADGVLICAFLGPQTIPMIVPDAAGGAIICWQDDRAGPGGIYAQRINAAGAILWPPLAGGVPICGAPGAQLTPTLVVDGAGGAIITWSDERFGVADVYAQHISAAGATLWVVDGAVVSAPPAGGAQDQPAIAVDGAGGAIIAWEDGRTPLLGAQIYAQHVTGLGVMTWAANGVVVCAIIGDQLFPRIVSDGAGGAIITWQDGRPPLAAGTSIYAEHVDGLGAGNWAAPLGVPVCTEPDDQTVPRIVSDGAGGAIIAWNDARSPLSVDVYAQRLSAAGVELWVPIATDVPISTPAGDQSWAPGFMPMVEDGNGGAIISWTDLRLFIATDIYAQNVNRDGTLGVLPVGYWRFEDGAGTTAADASGNGNDGSLVGPAAFTTDVPCASVIVQSNARPNGYSMNFPPSDPPVAEVTVPDDPTLRPGDGLTVEAWIRPTFSGGPIVTKQFNYVSGLDIREAWSFELDGIAAGGGVRFALCDTTAIITEVTSLEGTQYPLSDEWTHVAGTWDSTSGTMRLYVNFVEVASAAFAGPIGYDSHDVAIGGKHIYPDGSYVYQWYLGDIDEVRVSDIARPTIDMLRTMCPLAPIVIVNTPASDDTLIGRYPADVTWTAYDEGGVASITIEVSTDAGGSYSTLATGEANDGIYTWPEVPPVNSDMCIHRITAYDGEGNSRSGVTPGLFHIVTPPPTGIGLGPARFSLLTYPNPFNPSLTVDYSVPARGPVEVEVFDVQGRRVATLASGVMPAGEQVTTWDGRDERGVRVSSGVYFIRLTHRDKTLLRKAVLLK